MAQRSRGPWQNTPTGLLILMFDRRTYRFVFLRQADDLKTPHVPHKGNLPSSPTNYRSPLKACGDDHLLTFGAYHNLQFITLPYPSFICFKTERPRSP